jgi:hypothetical protein
LNGACHFLQRLQLSHAKHCLRSRQEVIGASQQLAANPLELIAVLSPCTHLTFISRICRISLSDIFIPLFFFPLDQNKRNEREIMLSEISHSRTLPHYLF